MDRSLHSVVGRLAILQRVQQRSRSLRSRSSLLFVSFLFLFLLGGGGALRCRLRFSSSYPTAAAPSRFATDLSGWEICGGINDAPGREMDPEAIELARFAVAEHNSKTNATLEFVRLVKVRTQVVAGYMYYFTIEVREDDGANKLYEAKVWLRQWEKFKGLHTFEPVANADQGEGKTKV